jgi:hypothetical protein
MTESDRTPTVSIRAASGSSAGRQRLTYLAVICAMAVVILAFWTGLAPHEGYWIWGELRFTPEEAASVNVSLIAVALESRGYTVAFVQGGPGQSWGELSVLNRSKPDFRAWIKNPEGSPPDARIYGELRYVRGWGAGSARFESAARQIRADVSALATDMGFAVDAGRITVEDTFDTSVDVSVRVFALFIAVIVTVLLLAFLIRGLGLRRSRLRSRRVP